MFKLLGENKDEAVIELEYLAEIIDILGNVTLLNKFAQKWTVLGLNKINEVEAVAEYNIAILESDYAFTPEQWAEENETLQAIVRKLDEFLTVNNLTTYGQIRDYVKAEGRFTSEETYTHENVTIIGELLVNVLELHTIEPLFPQLLSVAVDKVADAGYDISFIEGAYELSDLQADLPHLVNIAHILVDFGIFNFLGEGKEHAFIDLDYIALVIEELGYVTLLTKFAPEWTVLGLNKINEVEAVAEYGIVIDKADYMFTPEQWAEENATLQAIVRKVNEFLIANQIYSLSRIRDYVKAEGRLTSEETYTDRNLDIMGDIAELGLTLNTIEALFPQVLTIAINKAAEANFDASFLEGSLTIEEVKNDIDVFVAMAKEAIAFGALDYINDGIIAEIEFAHVNNIIDLVDSLDIYTGREANWAASITNYVSYIANLGFTVSANELSSVVWTTENDLLQEVIVKLEAFFEQAEIVSSDDVKAIVKGGMAKAKELATTENADVLFPVLHAVLDLQTLAVIVDDLADFGLGKVAERGYDLYFLVEKVNNEQIVEDMHSMLYAAEDLVDFGIIDIYRHNAVINYNTIDLVQSAITRLGNLNMLVDNGNALVEVVFNKYGIGTSGLANGTVKFSEEAEVLNAVISELVVVAENFGLDTIQDMKDFGLSSIKNNPNSDEHFDIIANILEIVAKDNFVSLVIFDLSEKFLSDKAGGLFAIHNMYPSYNEVAEDMIAGARILRNVADMHVYDALVGNVDFPLTNKLNIQNIINNGAKLNYFNLDGNMSYIIQSLGNMVGADLSFIDGDNIDLASDAELFIEMYGYLYEMFIQDDFPVKNRSDLSNMSGALGFFASKANLQIILDTVLTYMDTTVYAETGPIVFVIFVPLLKVLAPDYWAALDLDHYRFAEIEHDMDYFTAIFDSVMDIVPGIVSGEGEPLTNLANQYESIVNNVLETKLFGGKIDAVVELALADFIYGRSFGPITVTEGLFAPETDWEADFAASAQIVKDIVKILASESVNNTNEISNYVSNFDYLDFLANTEALENVAELIDHVSALTVVNTNAKAIYNEIMVPVLESRGYLSYFDYRNATSEEMLEDLAALADIVVVLSKMGLADIINEKPINYDQADNVTELFTIISNMNYLTYHEQAIINKLSNRFEGFNIYNATVDTIDLQADLIKFAEAYSKLIPILTDASFPVKTIADRNNIDVDAILEVIANNEAALVGFVDVVLDTSVAPYLHTTVIDAIKSRVPARLASVAAMLDDPRLTLDEIKEDYDRYVRIIEAVLETNLLEYVAFGDAEIPGQLPMITIINEVYALNLLEGKYNDMLETVMDAFNISKDGVDFANINWDQDKQTLVDIVPLVTELLDQLSVETYSEAIELLRSLTSVDGIIEFARETTPESRTLALDIVDKLVDTTLFYELGLNVARKALGMVGSLGEITSLAKYSKDTFNDDVHGGIEIVRTIINSSLIDNVVDRDLAINWADASIETVIRAITELHFLPLYGQELVDFVDARIGYDLSCFDNSNIDYANEQDAYINAYNELVVMLMNSEFPLRSVNDFLAFVKGSSDVSATDLINYVNAMSVIDAGLALAGTGLANEMYKLVMNVVSQTSIPLASYFDVSGQTKAEQEEDYLTFLSLAKDAINYATANGTFERVGFDFPIDDIATAQHMVDLVMSLHLFEGKYSDMIISLMNRFGMDTTNVDLSAVDYDYEAELAKELIYEIVTSLNEYNIHTFQEFKALASDLVASLRESKEQFLRDVKDILVQINVEHLLNIVELGDKSELVAQLSLPVYNKLVDVVVPAAYQDYLSLDGYTTANFDADYHLFAQAMRMFYESNAHKAYTSDYELVDADITLIQNAIKTMGQMYVLEYKKADMFALVDALVSADLSSIDVDKIVVADESAIVADMVPLLHKAYQKSNKFHFQISMFGDTELMETLIQLYEMSLTLETAKQVLPSMIRTYVLERLASAVGSSSISAKSDEEVLEMLDDSVDALYALRDMGAFSNNGIDLTDKALTDVLFNAILDNFDLGKYNGYIEKLANNVHYYGVLPVDYSVMSTRAEISAWKSALVAALDFVREYKSVMTDISAISDPAMQADVTALCNTALESKLINQIFMNLVHGSVQVVTKDYGSFTICDGMTSEEFVNIALPDIFQMIEYAQTLGVIGGGSLNYKDTATVIALVDLVVNSPVTKDNLNDFAYIALSKVLKVEITKQELVDANIDYQVEADYLEAFLTAMDPALQNVDINNMSTMTSPEFLSAFSVAGKELENSEFLKVIIKPLGNKVFGKVSGSHPELAFVQEVLDDSAYTNEYAMEDYMKVLEIVGYAANMDLFGDIDMNNLNGNIDKMIDAMFDTHASVGHEEDIMSVIVDKLPLGDSSINLDVVPDDEWDVEADLFSDVTAALATLTANPDFDLDNLTPDMILLPTVRPDFIAFIDAASKSYIGRDMFKQLFAEEVEGSLPADAQGLLDLDTLPANEWAAEFDEILDIYEVLNGKDIATLPAKDLVKVYAMLFGLTDYEATAYDGIESVKADYKGWLQDILGKASLPSTNGFVMDTNLITDANAYDEAVAFRNILVNLIGYMNNPETDLITDFDYSVLETCTDYEELHATFMAISKSVVMRELLIGIIGDAIITNSNSDDDAVFVLEDLVSAEFWAQYNKVVPYDEAFWSEDEYRLLAIILASANAFGIKNMGSVVDMPLGTEYPDVTEYSNIPGGTGSTLFPAQAAGQADANKVGLRQILQLMNISKVFSVEVLGGNNGIIANTFATIKPFDADFGTVSGTAAWQQEINNITDTLQIMKEKSLLDDGTDFTSFFNSQTDYNELTELLLAISSSMIMRDVLVEMIGEAFFESTNAGSAISLAKLASAEFTAQYNAVVDSTLPGSQYDEAFWTEEQFRVLAIILASATAYDLTVNIEAMEIGVNYPDVTAYSNIPGGSGSTPFPAQVAGQTDSNKVGLRQILQLMNVSALFDVSVLGGEDGIIASLFGQNLITFERPFGQVVGTAANQEEINDITYALYLMQEEGLVSQGADYAAKLTSMGEESVKNFLGAINKSEILRPIIAQIAYEAVVDTIAQLPILGGGTIGEDAAKTLVGSYYPWLAQQADKNYPLDTEANYQAHINQIAGLIYNPGDIFNL